jgi:hypothetical protein
MIQIANHGPLITASDYWRSDYANNDKIIVSPNAGAIRCLLPPALLPVIGDLRSSEYAIVSRGPWQGREGLEILWEDHTQLPHVWHVTSDACLLMPGDPSPHRWIISCWIERRGKPHKAIERPCHWRLVPRLPWLRPLHAQR